MPTNYSKVLCENSYFLGKSQSEGATIKEGIRAYHHYHMHSTILKATACSIDTALIDIYQIYTACTTVSTEQALKDYSRIKTNDDTVHYQLATTNLNQLET